MSEPAPHPISLQNVIFTKSFVQAVPNHEPREGQVIAPPDNNIHVAKLPDQPGVYAATMTTVVNKEMDKGTPYFVEMECMALLHADETLKEEEAARGVLITAHNVLYGAIREAVAWITGRQPYGAMVLGLSVLGKKAAPAPKES